MTATVHRLTPAGKNSVSKSTDSDAVHSATLSPSPDSLSRAAQQTLQIFTAMVSSSGARTRPLKKGMTEIEIAATFYASAVRYYTHPEQGSVQIEWSTMDSLIQTQYPNLTDRVDRGKLMHDEQFHEAWRISEELMKWSGHLQNPEGYKDPIISNPSYQPRSLFNWIAIPVMWCVYFIVALILPGAIQPAKREPSNEHPRDTD